MRADNDKITFHFFLAFSEFRSGLMATLITCMSTMLGIRGTHRSAKQQPKIGQKVNMECEKKRQKIFHARFMSQRCNIFYFLRNFMTKNVERMVMVNYKFSKPVNPHRNRTSYITNFRTFN